MARSSARAASVIADDGARRGRGRDERRKIVAQALRRSMPAVPRGSAESPSETRRRDASRPARGTSPAGVAPRGCHRCARKPLERAARRSASTWSPADVADHGLRSGRRVASAAVPRVAPGWPAAPRPSAPELRELRGQGRAELIPEPVPLTIARPAVEDASAKATGAISRPRVARSSVPGPRG